MVSSEARSAIMHPSSPSTQTQIINIPQHGPNSSSEPPVYLPLPTLAQALDSYRDEVNPEAMEIPASDTPDTPLPAESSITIEDDVAVSTLLVTFAIRYREENEFFSETRPEELEGLISSQDFYERMHQLNEKLARFRTLKDFTPLFRTFLLGTIPVGTVFACLYNYAWLGGLAVVIVLLLGSYFNDGAIFRLLKKEAESFSEADSSLKLGWSLTPRFPQNHKPLFCWSQEKAGVLVEWKLHIRQLSKEGTPEMECLPRYTPVWSRLSGMMGGSNSESDMEDDEIFTISAASEAQHPPSYRSMV
ncbi:hypothetical protein HDU98_007611 [Podochytrium sp. JEL0797]|nr:hypothetical protein HDU98_007611 [Podochytrium sp. JEL0797]